MRNFELSEEQYNKYLKWYDLQLEKDNELPTAGERFTFHFTPSGIGTIIKVSDDLLNELYDLTEYEYFG